MELRHLRYFKYIAETENISATSRKLHVSQPFLSQTIKLLEKELGVPLFERQGKKLILNKNGKLLYQYAREIISLEEEVIHKLSENSGKLNQSLKLILFNSTQLFPEMIADFNDSHPDINFSISNFDRERLTRPYDVVIHASDDLANRIPTQPLFQEECLLGMSINHPLAKEEHITADMLKNEKFLLLTKENTLGDLSRRYFVPLCINPHVPIECDTQQTLTALVSQNLGLAFFPSITWDIRAEDIVLRHIDNYILNRNIYLSVASSEPTEAVTTFIEYTKKYIKFALHKYNSRSIIH